MREFPPSFLVDGKTLCADVIVQLGEPNKRFEGERLLTYRIQKDDQGRLLVGFGRSWETLTHSLVIKCDGSGLVVRHALIAIKEN